MIRLTQMKKKFKVIEGKVVEIIKLSNEVSFKYEPLNEEGLLYKNHLDRMNEAIKAIYCNKATIK